MLFLSLQKTFKHLPKVKRIVAQSYLTLWDPWTTAHQASPVLELCTQKYWNGLSFPSHGIFPSQGSNLGLPHCRQILYHLSHQGSPPKFYKRNHPPSCCLVMTTRGHVLAGLWLDIYLLLSFLQRCFQQSERKSFTEGFFPSILQSQKSSSSLNCHTLYIRDWKAISNDFAEPRHHSGCFSIYFSWSQCLMWILLIEEVHILQMLAVKSF